MRKRSTYRPKPVFQNPLAFVLESARLLKDHDQYTLDWKIKNTLAFAALIRGEATRKDLDALVAAVNITEALLVVCKIDRDDGTIARASVALMDICARYAEGKRALYAPEMQALRDMIGIHDELMDLVTVAQFEKALAYARKEIRAGKAQKLKEV